MRCRDAIPLMHAFIDDDIDEYSHQELFEHIQSCPTCEQHFAELKATDQALRRIAKLKTSPSFTREVLAHIPEKKTNKISKSLRKYPLLVAATVFLLLFATSMIPYMNQSDELLKIVSVDQTDLIVEGNRVIVPEGKEVQGDLVVENGTLEIKGEVKGNVTVVNGNLLMASASQVDGHAQQIDQFFELIWYQLKKWMK
ncbi:zf-HC2 domain-containing protein [Tepidibacillus infernus]|uniref:Anti-sigma-W factor RsiW n=1 Tax=Tepidibacillus decaturensis TaxID=1413211 RepID=A0A135L0P5_9BACI|nr:zf-HC2 domain-containing protein [Tepidibacillus decaturensis]KXG42522.1 hypothetical protein U473_13650 [Tepidibacillus decaturensis]